MAMESARPRDGKAMAVLLRLDRHVGRGFGDQRHVVESGPVDRRDRFHDAAIGHGAVAADIDDAVVAVAAISSPALSAIAVSAKASSPRCSAPSAVMLTMTGFCGFSSGAALDFGSCNSTPDIISGAVTMKTINSTSITSTKGVTLISASG